MSILKIKALTYIADNTKILDNISLEIKSGELVSIVGSSGCGKSTLLKLCADLISTTEGSIQFKGKSYDNYDPIKLRRKISYCVQIPQLFGDIVEDNLVFPFKIRNDEVDYDRIDELLERFNLDKGYLSKKVNSLSGGEKQRIAIIRNLIYKPDILLLDEATSALDKENARRMEEYIKELNYEGVTVLWITHSLDQSEGIFNKRIIMSNGLIEKIEDFKESA